MVNNLSKLFELINDLSVLSTSVEFVTIINRGDIDLQVKSKGRGKSLINELKKIQKNLIGIFPESNSQINFIEEGINDWIEHFDEEYSIKSKILKIPENIREKDAQKFLKDIEKWLDRLYAVCESEYTLDKTSKSKKIPPLLIKDLKSNTKKDLSDALKCMDDGLYTPAYMLLLRVAEEEVKIFYEKITGTKPPTGRDSAWGSLLNKLAVEHKKKFNREITNILFNLLPKRNEAQHPGKRFKKDDCEEIYNYLLVLKKEISK